MNRIFQKRYEIVVAILFIISFYVRVNINSIYPNNPGNVKASDPVYHTLVADYIAKTGLVGRQPDYLSQGHTDVVDIVPPHLATAVGVLTNLSGIKAWNVYYVVVCLFSALAVPLLYLICTKIFNKETGLIAAGLIALPLKIDRWLYFLYIGIWQNNTVFTLILLAIYLSLAWLEKKKPVYLLLLGICNAAIYLLHYSEFTLLVPIYAYLLFSILKGKARLSKKTGELFMVFGPAGVTALLSFSVLVVTRLAGGTDSMPKTLLFHMVDFASQYSYIPTIKDFGLYLIPIILAAVQLALNYRKYLGVIVYNLYYFLLAYVMPYTVKEDFYLLRLRPYMIYLLVTVSAYGCYYFIYYFLSTVKLGKKKEVIWLASVIAVILLFLSLGAPGFISLKNQLKGHLLLPENRYEGHEWIQANTPNDALIYYFGGDGQTEDNYLMRVKYKVNVQTLQERFPEIALQYNKSNTLPLTYEGMWGYTSWSNLAYPKSLFELGHHPLKKDVLEISEFDYVYFENLNMQIAQYNVLLATYLIENLKFKVVFNNPVTIILQNEGK